MRRPHLDALLTAMLESHPTISDLVFATGRPLQVEADGVLQEVMTQPPLGFLTPYQTEQIAMNIVGDSPRLVRELLTRGACDCGYTMQSSGLRLRVNIYRQRGFYSIVMRRTASEIPSLAALTLPTVFKEIARERSGLVLITGATGSGKSTTLSALLDEINSTQPVHIVTLEDPIEFLYEQKRATISQRELGSDFDDFAHGLRSAMRQAPKVILVGEVRDRATMEIVLSAAETGHLVFTTLPTTSITQTIGRLMGMVDVSEQAHLRLRLTESLRYIVAQRLVPRIGGGRHLVQEIMGTNLRVRELLSFGEGEGRSFYDIIEANAAFGWSTFDLALVRAFENGLITDETALLYGTNKAKVGRMIDEMRKRGGVEESLAFKLRLDASGHAPAPAPVPATMPAPALAGAPPPLPKGPALPPGARLAP